MRHNHGRSIVMIQSRRYAVKCFFTCVAVCAALLGLVEPGGAAEETSKENKFASPDVNLKDEPITRQFSLDAAGRFLDAAALDWQKTKNCCSCHTNYPYLYARPAISSQVAAHDEVRRYMEELVSKRWNKEGPRWDAEVVATAMALALNDTATTGKLHPHTKTALDRMWTVQRKDGGWSWINCGWPPMESDDHYGATLAAIAVGAAPEGYAKTEAARKGMENVRRYFQANPPQNLHHKAMLLWADSFQAGWMTKAEKKSCMDDLLALQKADGGWALATLGDWKRGDKGEQDRDTSDGYGTGFSLFILRRGGVAANDPAVQRGIAWLKSHQRESGRWFTRSLTNDKKHYITHIGSAFAVMALAACGERPALRETNQQKSGTSGE